jgi:hypothetical protein
MLEANEDAALLAVDRIIWNNDVPITSVSLPYASDYRMKTRIQVESCSE